MTTFKQINIRDSINNKIELDTKKSTIIQSIDSSFTNNNQVPGSKVNWNVNMLDSVALLQAKESG